MGSLCGLIVEATLDGPQALPARIEDGSQAFSLADLAPGPDCAQRGWADQPTWSPDGLAIAFFAAPAAMGQLGPSRAAVPANLYVMEPDAQSASALLQGVSVPRGLSYSPDGRFLAFGGEIGGEKATWVLDRTSREVRRVYDHRFEWLAWSPDGSEIAGLQMLDPERPLESAIIIISVIE